MAEAAAAAAAEAATGALEVGGAGAGEAGARAAVTTRRVTGRGCLDATAGSCGKKLRSVPAAAAALQQAWRLPQPAQQRRRG